MNKYQALLLLHQEMQRYGLTDWYAELDNAKTRFGQCKHTVKKITLSEPLVSLNDEKEVLDTIYHEIAHALVGGGHGHDRIWQRKALELGSNGKRGFSADEIDTPIGKFIYVCKNCGKKYNHYKKLKRAKACGDCCRKFNGGRFSLDYEIILKK